MQPIIVFHLFDSNIFVVKTFQFKNVKKFRKIMQFSNINRILTPNLAFEIRRNPHSLTIHQYFNIIVSVKSVDNSEVTISVLLLLVSMIKCSVQLRYGDMASLLNFNIIQILIDYVT
jgi:hypothetical protein